MSDEIVAENYGYLIWQNDYGYFYFWDSNRDKVVFERLQDALDYINDERLEG